ncbi:MAG: hypothetical protein JW754_01645 [Candidatus Aenigmarchaeota archaeon]|nr:hypothetical protein [Candidatus Aenigmarchaeota archaeon]
MFREWKHGEDVLAQRISRKELPGRFRKEIQVADGIAVLIEKDRKIYRILQGGGSYSVNTIDLDFTHALFVDASDKVIKKEIRNIRTREVRKLGMELDIGFRISDPDELQENIMKSRTFLYVDDLWDIIYMELLSSVIAPYVGGAGLSDIYRDSGLKDRVKKGAENKVREILGGFGIEMTSFGMKWNFPKDMPGPSETEGDKVGESREEKLAELEKKRLEKEVDMQLEKEETQRDMEDAVEALELRKIKEEMSEEEVKNGIEELKRAKEIAEQKFFKKEIEEDAFKRMAEEYERKIIELESRLPKEKEKKEAPKKHEKKELKKEAAKEQKEEMLE